MPVFILHTHTPAFILHTDACFHFTHAHACFHSTQNTFFYSTHTHASIHFTHTKRLFLFYTHKTPLFILQTPPPPQKTKLTAVDRGHLPQGIRRGLHKARHESKLYAVLFLEILLVGLAHVHQVRHVALLLKKANSSKSQNHADGGGGWVGGCGAHGECQGLQHGSTAVPKKQPACNKRHAYRKR